MHFFLISCGIVLVILGAIFIALDAIAQGVRDGEGTEIKDVQEGDTGWGREMLGILR